MWKTLIPSITFLLFNEGVNLVVKYIPQVSGFLYGFFALIIIIALWKTGRMTRKIGYLFLIASAIFGFTVFGPVAPYQFQTLILRNLSSFGGPAVVVIIGLLFFIVMSFLFGRIFCGNICPVGVLQEIISIPSIGKKGRTAKKYSVPFRAAVFVVFFISGLFFSVSILDLMGVRDFFYLEVSTSFFIFSAFLIASLFVYRPFCRFICPYGVLLSFASAFGVCKFRRTDKCIECGKCEKICPVDEAKRDDNKSECYMCGRCMEVCPVDGALVYSKKQSK